jgi:hypothetical protein
LTVEAAFSPDGKTILSGAATKAATVGGPRSCGRESDFITLWVQGLTDMAMDRDGVSACANWGLD